MDIEALERLIEPEDEEVCLRDHFAASKRLWLERQEEKVAVQESWQTEWHDMKYRGLMAKAPPCFERTLNTPFEESQWVSAEDRHRRRVAFEKTAKGMLRYLEDGEEFKVGVTELQE